MWMLADAFDAPNSVFVVGGVIAITAIVFGSVKHILVARGREKTKREIAAYVAEGSIEPEKAVEMLKAGNEAAEE